MFNKNYVFMYLGQKKTVPYNLSCTKKKEKNLYLPDLQIYKYTTISLCTYPKTVKETKCYMSVNSVLLIPRDYVPFMVYI